jgi:hypothetical protein
MSMPAMPSMEAVAFCRSELVPVSSTSPTLLPATLFASTQRAAGFSHHGTCFAITRYHAKSLPSRFPPSPSM